MNLPALYDLLTARTDHDGVIRLPSWCAIATAAEVDPFEDSTALRALIDKGAVVRRTVPNTYGDCVYTLRWPAPGKNGLFRAALAVGGATVTKYAV